MAAMSDPAAARPSAEPFLSSVMAVEPQWIDYNGHLNMAYYNVLFDRCVDEALLTVGLGPEYARDAGASFFAVEAHICYLRELADGDRVRATFRLVDHDDKRLHAFLELIHAEEGWLSATSEQLFLHVDLAAKRVVPWPDAVEARIRDMARTHAALPPEPRIGRAIAIRRRTD